MHLLGNHTNHHTNHHPSPRDPVRGSRQIVSLGWSWVLGRGSWVVGRGSRIIGRGRGRQREAEAVSRMNVTCHTTQHSAAQHNLPKFDFGECERKERSDGMPCGRREGRKGRSKSKFQTVHISHFTAHFTFNSSSRRRSIETDVNHQLRSFC